MHHADPSGLIQSRRIGMMHECMAIKFAHPEDIAVAVVAVRVAVRVSMSPMWRPLVVGIELL